YSKECYILKLDIKGYFMAMNKKIIYEKIASLLNKEKMKHSFDLALTLHLIEQTLFNNPTKDCITKSSMSDWEGLPPTKSLFHAKSGCGLPIGNLTSQLFGNIYLNEFDHFVKRDLKIRFYGRYVDDFVLIHPDKNYLASIIPVMKNFLSDNLQLELHPDKIYLQHYSKGVKYLGAVIKPHRIYMANRTKGNFYQSIETWNIIIRAEKKLTKEEQDGFLSSMNSYLGIMKHYKTYKLRKKMLKENLSAYFWNYFYIGKNYVKLVRKIKKVRGLNFFLCMACSCWTVGYLG
ncbi:MAG: RNA-directed DNA polymerase, partial [Nitrospirota bacterium]